MPTRHDLQPIGAHGYEPDQPAHTPGPWAVDWQGPDHPIYAGEACVATAWAGDADANAARIVACVNACEGMADPAAALAEVRAALLSARGFLRHGEDGGLTPGDVEDRLTQALALLGAS